MSTENKTNLFVVFFLAIVIGVPLSYSSKSPMSEMNSPETIAYSYKQATVHIDGYFRERDLLFDDKIGWFGSGEVDPQMILLECDIPTAWYDMVKAEQLVIARFSCELLIDHLAEPQ
ncbi:hypothetical protein ACFL6U_08835 [Planctomycetota bacterium]